MLAFELMVNVPLAAPAAVGVKMALKVVDWPALRVIGKVGPVKLNPLPDAAALETVTVWPPLLVTATETVLLLPTVTLPKLALLGFAVKEPAVRPVPESPILSGELGASETIATVPVTAPAAVGAKPTLKVTL